MAYDNFENTSFDLNRDGKIDSNEAAYIYETFYNDNNSEDCGNSVTGYGSSSTYSSRKQNSRFNINELRREEQKSQSRRNAIAIGIVIVLAIIFNDSPGVAIFAGLIMLSLKLSGAF